MLPPIFSTEQQTRQRLTLLSLLAVTVHVVGLSNVWSYWVANAAAQQVVCQLGLAISLAVLYLAQFHPANRRAVRVLALLLALIWLLAGLVPPEATASGQSAATNPHILGLLNLALLCYALLPAQVAGWMSAGSYLLFLLGVWRFHGTPQLPDLSAGITLLLLHYVGSHSYDMLNVRERAQKLAHLAAYDQLTGLLNRYGMEENLRQLWEQAQQTGEDGTLLLLDIDHFKSINDQFGHAVGDRVLRRVGRILPEVCPKGTVGRWGGEEFLMVLPALSSSETELLAKQLTACLVPTGRALPSGRPVTLSGGGVRFSEAASLPQLIALADQRLYVAKGEGRNRLKWTSPPEHSSTVAV
ncbi:hypothetical protein GCM10017783_13750 [Deinococcus piscis]|uniref:GGDEF domain-containing protein n=1 Tax=Deinococcus piscis TaxID=394230 RepID=A0ABQ3K3U1_9DEIO|nr:GGDEF domain-containing protein [Deinococcus piscis]GHG02732.1 hypothetical protein GCM10017783_13750 [Deinococcus piscis]